MPIYLAEEVIADRVARNTLPEFEDQASHCPACHYPRQGLNRDDCPECGTAFTPVPLSPDERQRLRGKAIRLVVVIVAIQILVSLILLVVIAL
ncbi:MAG: hypothetical protein AAGH99_12780 [Planctomycetota bacterium]